MPILKRLVLFSALSTLVPFASSQSPRPLTARTEAPSLPEGVPLPPTGMVYVFDAKQKEPGLVQLHGSEIVTNTHAAGNFARSAIYIGPRSSVEVQGLNAATHLVGSRPSFYVRVSADDIELFRGRIHLIRMTQTKGRRVVSTHSENIFGGQRVRKYDDVNVTKTNDEPNVWVKVTPQADLAPGEYGIIVAPQDSTFIPDSVYDFDVAFDGAAPVPDENRPGGKK